jgi:hypothetical protein
VLTYTDILFLLRSVYITINYLDRCLNVKVE